MQTPSTMSPEQSSEDGSSVSRLTRDRFWKAQAEAHASMAGASMEEKVAMLDSLMRDYAVMEKAGKKLRKQVRRSRKSTSP